MCIPHSLCVKVLNFKFFWWKTNIRSSEANKPTRLFEEQKDVHPSFPFQPSFIKVFYSIGKYSSDMAYANHSFIGGAEGCAFPIPFSTGFIEREKIGIFFIKQEKILDVYQVRKV